MYYATQFFFHQKSPSKKFFSGFRKIACLCILQNIYGYILVVRQLCFLYRPTWRKTRRLQSNNEWGLKMREIDSKNFSPFTGQNLRNRSKNQNGPNWHWSASRKYSYFRFFSPQPSTGGIFPIGQSVLFNSIFNSHNSVTREPNSRTRPLSVTTYPVCYTPLSVSSSHRFPSEWFSEWLSHSRIFSDHVMSSVW